MSTAHKSSVSEPPPNVPWQNPPKRQKRKRNLKSDQNWRRSYVPRSLNDLQGPDHLAASTLPEGFPPELAFRALAAYSLLRTLSVELRLSPFTPNVFLRALNLPYPSRLLGQIHVALLKVLLPALNMGYSYRPRGGYVGVVKRRKVDGLRWELRAGDNLTYLDSYSWPLFYDDFVHLTADILHSFMNDTELLIDHRILAIQNSTDEELKVDCDDDEPVTLSKETESVVDESDDPKQEDVRSPKIFRPLFGALPTRAKKMQAAKGKSPQSKPLAKKRPISFLSRNGAVKPEHVDPESTESEDDHSDFYDAEKEIDDDDEYLKKPTKATLGQRRTMSRKRKISKLGSGSRVYDVEVFDRESWQRINNNGLGGPGVRCNKVNICLPHGLISPNTNVRAIPKKCASTPSALKLHGSEINRVASSGHSVPPPIASQCITTSSILLNEEFSIGNVPGTTIDGTANSDSMESISSQGMTRSLPMPVIVPQVIHPAPAWSYNGFFPPSNSTSVPSPPVESFVSSSPQSLFASRHMHMSKAVVPRFKLEGRRPKGTPVPASIADDIHNFITNTTTEAAASQRLGTRADEPGNRENQECVDLVTIAGLKHETSICVQGQVSLVIDHMITKIASQLNHPASKCKGEASMLGNNVDGIYEEIKSYHNNEVKLIMAEIIDQLDKSPPSSGSATIHDEEANEVLSLMNSLVDRVEENSSFSPVPSNNKVYRDQGPGSRASPSHFLEDNKEHAGIIPVRNPLWPQFDPIEPMRNGTPYYRLPVEQKLQIMEFLIDELLTVDLITAEFNRRHHLCNCYPYPYGTKPAAHEFESLDNGDECGVCGLEGDLLCCDGCPRSYHRKCLSMSERADLPQGKWLCPECSIVDSANFGSLRGGKKGAVDWFTINDLQTARVMSVREEQQRILLSQSHAMSQVDVLAMPWERNLEMEPAHMFTKMPHAALDDTIIQSYVPGTALDTNQSSILPVLQGAFDLPHPIPSDCVSKQGYTSANFTFLVVHGFVFAKETIQAEEHITSSPKSLSTLKAMFNEHGLMSQEYLLKTMKELGRKMFLEWPLNQIPHNASHVWKPCHDDVDSVASSVVDFFKDADRFDPSKYLSQYRLASMPKITKTVSAARQAGIMNNDYETECCLAETRNLSAIMEADMSRDSSLASALSSSTFIFNPYRMLVGYMEKLESTLRRAFLLNEFWGTRNKAFKMDIWVINLRRCQSIAKMAALIVHLIDATHARAFVDDWNAPPTGRVKNDQLSTQENRIRYRPLAEDWSSAGEKRVRKWKRCSITSFLSLLASETDDLDGLIDGVCERFRGRTTQRTKKRKLNTKIVRDVTIVNRVTVTLDPTISTLGLKNSAVLTPNVNSFCTIVDNHKPVAITLSKQEQGHATDSGGIGDPLLVAQTSDDEGDNLLMVAQRTDEDEPTIKSTAQSGETSLIRIIKTTSGVDTENSATKQTSHNKTRRSRRRKTADGSNGSSTTPKMATIIEEQRRGRLAELEQFLKMPLEKQLNWPVAGRNLFQPVGLLSPSEVRYLGRNAGIVPAANVTYSKAYEVGQVAVSHIWRKRVLNSISFEELMIQIKVLDSFLDKTTINSCEGLMRRAASSKAIVPHTIECCQRDSGTGVLHYFVVQQKKRNGCWLSAMEVDLLPFLHECERRVNKQLQIRNEKMRNEEVLTAAAEKIKQDAITTRQDAERIEKAAQARKTLEIAQREARNRTEAAKLHQHRETQRKATTLIRAPSCSSFRDDDTSMSSFPRGDVIPRPEGSTRQLPSESVAKLNHDIELALTNHMSETRESLFRCAQRGETHLTRQEMNHIRQRTMHRILSMNQKLRFCGADCYNDSDIPELLMQAEGQVTDSLRDTRMPITNITPGRDSAASASRIGCYKSWDQSGPQHAESHLPDGYNLRPGDQRKASHRDLYNFQSAGNTTTPQLQAGVSHSRRPSLGQMHHQNAILSHIQSPMRKSHSGSTHMPLATHSSLEGPYVGSRHAGNGHSTTQGGNYMQGMQQQQQHHHHHQQGGVNYGMGYPHNSQLIMLRQQEQLQSQQQHHLYQEASQRYGIQPVAAVPYHPSLTSTNNPGAFDPRTLEGLDLQQYGQGPYHNHYPPGNNPANGWM